MRREKEEEEEFFNHCKERPREARAYPVGWASFHELFSCLTRRLLHLSGGRDEVAPREGGASPFFPDQL